MNGLIRRELFRRLDSLEGGSVRVEDSRGSVRLGRGTDDEPAVTVPVHRDRFYRRAALAGSLGVAEAWADGDWTCDDPTALFRMFVANIATGRVKWVTPRFLEPVARWTHVLRGNTKDGSRRNIRDHYDLGNEFFEQFLDDTMTYSCGIFPRPGATLREASVEKLDTVCRKLRLGPEDHVLEIGTGWGSFAMHAAGQYGCRVTTTTISKEQHRYATDRIAAAGLTDRVNVVREDYRDLRGTYDKIASIEMIEAVGHEHLPDYFAACDRLLAPDGTMVLQAITMPDRDHAEYLRTVDFIQKYVFPGSCLPSLGSLVSSIARTSLRVDHVEDIGIHYAPTLAAWRERFRAASDRIRELAGDDRFLRIWEYYFCYCEAGFAERYLGDLQLRLVKPGGASGAEWGAA
jgi:cyclopropane-fatty-acyl-phospholipid synthase